MPQVQMSSMAFYEEVPEHHLRGFYRLCAGFANGTCGLQCISDFFHHFDTKKRSALRW